MNISVIAIIIVIIIIIVVVIIFTSQSGGQSGQRVINNINDPIGVKSGKYKQIPNNNFFSTNPNTNWNISIKFNLDKFNNTLQSIIANMDNNGWGLWVTPERRLQWRIGKSIWDLTNLGELKDNTPYQIDIKYNGSYNFNLKSLDSTKSAEYFQMTEMTPMIINAPPINTISGSVTLGGTEEGLTSTKFLGSINEVLSTEITPTQSQTITPSLITARTAGMITTPASTTMRTGGMITTPFTTTTRTMATTTPFTTTARTMTSTSQDNAAERQRQAEAAAAEAARQRQTAAEARQAAEAERQRQTAEAERQRQTATAEAERQRQAEVEAERQAAAGARQAAVGARQVAAGARQVASGARQATEAERQAEAERQRQARTGKVIIYADSDYSGSSVELDVGTYDSNFLNSRGFNDNISSLKVPQGLQVEGWEHGIGEGPRWVFTSDTNWVGDANDKISSLRISDATNTIAPVCDRGPQALLGNNTCTHWTYQDESSEQRWRMPNYHITGTNLPGWDCWYAPESRCIHPDCLSNPADCGIRKNWE